MGRQHRLSILHISDLHARTSDVEELPEALREKRQREVHLEAASRDKVVGEAWDGNLRAMYPNGERPDLICFTGDVADWGLTREYERAQSFLDRLVGTLGVARERIYPVPGNHDVRRYHNDNEWTALRKLMWSETQAVSRWLAGQAPPRAVDARVRDAVLDRSARFWGWVEGGLGRPELCPRHFDHGRLGYRHCPELGLPFPVHVIGLDSAWLSGDDNDQGKLWLTQHQRDLLLRDKQGAKLPGFRLALVHHPLTELAQPDVEPSQRDLADCVDLLLHGHQHTPAGSSLLDLDGRALRVLAAGCLYEGTEGSAWKNACQRIDVVLDDAGRPQSAELQFRAWSARGHWYADGSLYKRQSDGGRLRWDAWGSVPASPGHSQSPVASGQTKSKQLADLLGAIYHADKDGVFRLLGQRTALKNLCRTINKDGAPDAYFFAVAEKVCSHHVLTQEFRLALREDNEAWHGEIDVVLAATES